MCTDGEHPHAGKSRLRRWLLAPGHGVSQQLPDRSRRRGADRHHDLADLDLRRLDRQLGDALRARLLPPRRAHRALVRRAALVHRAVRRGRACQRARRRRGGLPDLHLDRRLDRQGRDRAQAARLGRADRRPDAGGALALLRRQADRRDGLRPAGHRSSTRPAWSNTRARGSGPSPSSRPRPRARSTARIPVDEPMVSVFLPTTPNPTSGFLLFVPRHSVIELDMTVEDAAKLVISAGLVYPNGKEPRTRSKPPPPTPPRHDRGRR